MNFLNKYLIKLWLWLKFVGKKYAVFKIQFQINKNLFITEIEKNNTKVSLPRKRKVFAIAADNSWIQKHRFLPFQISQFLKAFRD